MMKGKKGVRAIGLLVVFATACFLAKGEALAASGNPHELTDTTGLSSNLTLPFVEWTNDLYGWTVDEPLPAGEEVKVGDKSHSFWYESGTTGVL